MLKYDNLSRLVEISEGDSHHTFPSAWIRENCRCSQCFYVEGHQRLIEPGDIGPHQSTVHSASIFSTVLQIEWADGHKSEFQVRWLFENDGFNGSTKPDDYAYRVPWTTSSLSRIPTVEYDHVISGETSEHLAAMAKYGVFLVNGAPKEDRTVVRFADCISFSGVRSTNFGEMFNLRIHNHQNMKLAFTNRRISLHNDLVIRRQPPTVTLLHCLSTSGKGGSSLLSDGLAIANFLKETHPEQFATLCSVLVEIEDKNKDWHYVARKPVIEFQGGTIRGVNYNNWERSPYINIDPHDYDRFSCAYTKFCQLAHSRNFCHDYSLAPGEIIVIDNTRLLHGRSSFSDDSGATRHLQGCHIDIDDLISAYRNSRGHITTSYPLL